MYAMCCTCFDFAHTVRHLSKFIANPSEDHWQAAMHLLRYIKGTLSKKLCYDGKAPFPLKVYVDADFANDIETRKSVGGIITFVASGPVSWCSKSQATVALSSTEAEYGSLAEGAREVVFIRQLLADMKMEQSCSRIYQDNQQAIGLAINPMHRARNKHLDVKLHFIREKIERKELEVVYVNTNDEIADMTKPLAKRPFQHLRHIALDCLGAQLRGRIIISS
jgi:hypothetical protein